MAASGGHWNKGVFVSAGAAMHEADRQIEMSREDKLAAMRQKLGIDPNPPAPFKTWADKRRYDESRNPSKNTKRKAAQTIADRKARAGSRTVNYGG